MQSCCSGNLPLNGETAVTDGRSKKSFIHIREEFIMSMVVKNNMSAISTLNTLNKNSSALASSL